MFSVVYEGKIVAEDITDFAEATKCADQWWLDYCHDNGIASGEVRTSSCMIVEHSEDGEEVVSRYIMPLECEGMYNQLEEHGTRG